MTIVFLSNLNVLKAAAIIMIMIFFVNLHKVSLYCKSEKSLVSRSKKRKSIIKQGSLESEVIRQSFCSPY